MYNQIDQKIKVAAVFEPAGAVRPVWFVFSGRRHRVQETTFTWRSRQGQAEILHFSVSDGADVFEISFNHQTLSWTLEKSYVE